jgi:hypothetical protein
MTKLLIYCQQERLSNMPEYFDISLIMTKTENSKEEMSKCLIENFGLLEGENITQYFDSRKVLVVYIEDDESDFDEICIGFAEQIFHKKTFKKELEVFTSFITTCFECCNEVQYAVCSYELNGYLLGSTKKLNEFNDELLSKFPIYWKRKYKQEDTLMVLNLEAQEILT